MGGRARLEVEIKLPVATASQARALLRHAHAERLDRYHELNLLFDWPDRRLSRAGCVLRVRQENGRAVLTFKAPAPGSKYKTRQELEVTVGSAEVMAELLHRLGLRVWFCYEKYRTRYRLPGFKDLLVELDETPIGVFLELEGPGPQIDRAARRLGYSPQDYLTASYYELFRRHPDFPMIGPHMLFARKGAKRSRFLVSLLDKLQ